MARPTPNIQGHTTRPHDAAAAPRRAQPVQARPENTAGKTRRRTAPHGSGRQGGRSRVVGQSCLPWSYPGDITRLPWSSPGGARSRVRQNSPTRDAKWPTLETPAAPSSRVTRLDLADSPSFPPCRAPARPLTRISDLPTLEPQADPGPRPQVLRRPGRAHPATPRSLAKEPFPQNS